MGSGAAPGEHGPAAPRGGGGLPRGWARAGSGGGGALVRRAPGTSRCHGPRRRWQGGSSGALRGRGPAPGRVQQSQPGQRPAGSRLLPRRAPAGPGRGLGCRGTRVRGPAPAPGGFACAELTLTTPPGAPPPPTLKGAAPAPGGARQPGAPALGREQAEEEVPGFTTGGVLSRSAPTLPAGRSSSPELTAKE